MSVKQQSIMCFITEMTRCFIEKQLLITFLFRNNFQKSRNFFQDSELAVSLCWRQV